VDEPCAASLTLPMTPICLPCEALDPCYRETVAARSVVSQFEIPRRAASTTLETLPHTHIYWAGRRPDRRCPARQHHRLREPPDGDAGVRHPGGGRLGRVQGPQDLASCCAFPARSSERNSCSSTDRTRMVRPA